MRTDKQKTSVKIRSIRCQNPMRFVKIHFVLATLLALITAACAPAPSPSPSPDPLPLPTEYAVRDEGREIIEQIYDGRYAHYPPSSGKHYNLSAQWGFYKSEIPPEFYIGSLELGGIVILYNCPQPCPQTEAALTQLLDIAPPDAESHQVMIVISPNSKIGSPVVALAWGWELDLPRADLNALVAFYQNHVGQQR